MLSTKTMLKKVVKASGICLEVQKILCPNWISTYFIYHTKSFKNGKISFIVDYMGETRTWTNFDFLEFYKNEKWIVRS
jgi:hypothetical protein